MEEVITVVLYFHRLKKQVDLQVPINISATGFVIGVNEAYNLGIDINDLSKCYLRSENPIALLKGERTLKDFNLNYILAISDNIGEAYLLRAQIYEAMWDIEKSQSNKKLAVDKREILNKFGI